jgi:cyclopropane-fatty-acyl-phospholipid synthase
MSGLERLGLWILGRLAPHGTLLVTLPGGETRAVGRGLPYAEIRVTDFTAVRDTLRMGLIGFSEAYMDGRIESPDLPGVLRWATVNRQAWFEHPLTRATSPIRRWWQRIRPERRHPRVRSMEDHYNLGNGFYAGWLDETMTYSSARFAEPGQSLADAQRNKYRTIGEHVGLRPGMRVLEIGCGWGGFAEYAAGLGCEVVSLTLSEEQASFARKRLAERGLEDLVDVRLADFRTIQGRFDAVVSIEMIESVDETQWPDLFATIARSLDEGALVAMQIITIEDGAWEAYRSRPDFIQQYIFPGGQIPAPKVIRRLASEQGLEVEQVEQFGLDYARTLAAWRERFEAAWPSLAAAHGLDERFHRMWELYLSLCEAGFRMGRTDVQQWVFCAAGTAAGQPGIRVPVSEAAPDG